jgi:hypothetical protein
MIISQLSGGLGNQLFQYAAAKALSLHHQEDLLLDISLFQKDELHELEVPRSFELYQFTGVKEPIAGKAEMGLYQVPEMKNPLLKLLPRHRRPIYTEPFFHYDANFWKARKHVLLKGQWQSPRYFEKYAAEIRGILQLKPELTERVAPLADQFRSEETVAVHVRRNDYLRLPIILAWHGVMDTDYYRKAFSILEEKLGDFKVVYFTDDPQWVEQELVPLRGGTLVSGEMSRTHYEDFHLMANCRHNIVANSSFSWWSAWRNTNPGKIVIAPKRWFGNGPQDTQDLTPPDWLRI